MTAYFQDRYSSPARVRLGGVLLYLAFPIIVLVDIISVLCNNIIFPLVGIDRVKRKDYIKPFSRIKLMEVGLWYKIGCVYCSYANGVAYYFQIIAMKTEFLYCPWKQKDKTKIFHHRYFKDW